MDNDKQQGTHAGEPNPSQKDPQQKNEKDNQQRQGGTQPDQQHRPGRGEPNPEQDQQKDKKIA